MDKKSTLFGFCLVALTVGAVAQTNVTTTNGGTAGTVPVFTSGSNVESSPISVSGSNVGIGTAAPGNALSVNGVIGAGGTYFSVLDYNYNGTPNNGIKIVTSIPYQNAAEMPTVVLRGYDYSTSSPIGLILNWYVYQGVFTSYAASSFGAYTPPIQLASETISGSSCGTCVVIFISDRSYFERFTVDAYAHGMSEQPSWFNGWSFADASVASDGAGASNVVTLPFVSVFGGNSPNTLTSVKGQATGAFTGTANGLLRVEDMSGNNNVIPAIDFDANGGIPLARIGADITSSGTLLQFGTSSLYASGVSNIAMTINPGGNVGIGTVSPAYTLDVTGTIRTSTGGVVYPDGTTQTTAWTGVLCGGDYAEDMRTQGNKASYEPGDVLVLASGDNEDVQMSAEPYSTLVAGIFATKPGVVGRRAEVTGSAANIPMAMVGVVPTKVSTENGPIHKGDLLVTSSKPGFAMKGTDRSRMLGAVIGKAMGSLNSGMGVIEVLVALQ